MNISTKRKRGCRTLERKREKEREREREREREMMMMMTAIYINVKQYTKITMRLKTGVEPIWFEIMPCASFYSVLMNTLEIFRMFHRNLEYTSTFYNKT